MGLDIELLDRLEPGAALAEALAEVDSASLSGYARIVVIKAQQRQVAHYQAQAYGQMAAIVPLFLAEDDDYECAYDSASAEIGDALHLTRRAADYELDTALALSERIPEVGEALLRGEIDLRRARTFRWGTGHLEEEVARQIVAQVIGRAKDDDRRPARRLPPPPSNATRPRSLPQALPAGGGRAAGGVGGEPDWFGQPLRVDLPAELATQIMARICALADSAKTAADPRTMDQIRADVYLDLLIGNAASKKQGVVNLHVDLETLTRLNENPGELAGYGPVISDLARQVAEA